MSSTPIQAVILCGGFGTRFREQTELRPKPMIEVCGRPILTHIMTSYASQGFKDFVLCLGYKASVIKRYFLDYGALNSDFTVDLRNQGNVEFHRSDAEDWKVTCADTGLNAMTGCRLKRVEKYIEGDEFLLTYGDGLSDVDVAETLAFHRAHGKAATVTGVRPRSRFGELVAEGDRVAEFSEKPAVEQGYINAGFFVFSRKVFDYVADDESCVLERDPLEALARDGELMIYRHHGFWQCMDTARDLELLEKHWRSGKAPWLR